MKKQHIILSGIALTALMVLLYLQKNNHAPSNTSAGNTDKSGLNQGGESHPNQTVQGSGSNTASTNNGSQNGNGSDAANGSSAAGNSSNSGAPSDGTQKNEPAKKENNCFRYAYQHEAKNQNRDIEDFLNDTNAFPINHENVNTKSICVKVNDKPVNHKLVKKHGKSEVIIGSVVGPESTIQVSYCIGAAPCKESCVVKTNNKVDELLSDSDMGGLENAELESQVKELRNVASAHGDLMDSTIIRDWNKLQTKEWVCEK